MTMPVISIGSMRHPVVIEQPTKVADGQGGFTRSGWTSFLSGYAHIEPLSAKERLFSFQKAMSVSHKITMRYRWDKTPTIEMRVNYTVGANSRIFMITGIINIDERNRFLTLLCTEGVGV